MYCLIVAEEWKGLWEDEIEEWSRSGFITVLKSPPIIIWELGMLDIAEKKEWKKVGESLLRP